MRETDEFWWGLKDSKKLCCLSCGAHGPAELLGRTTVFSLLNAGKKWNDDSESWLQWRRRKQCIVASTMPRAALAGATTPCSVRNVPVESSKVVGFFLFGFPLKKKLKKSEPAQFRCWLISNEIPVSWSYLCSHLSKRWNLHYRRSPVQVLSNCEMPHSLHRLLGFLLDFL